MNINEINMDLKEFLANNDKTNTKEAQNEVTLFQLFDRHCVPVGEPHPSIEEAWVARIPRLDGEILSLQARYEEIIYCLSSGYFVKAVSYIKK